MRFVKALLCATLLAAAAPVAKAADVLIFAAASTTNAVNAVIDVFEAPPGTQVRASYASSGTLARQIANGAPAHLYLSANEKWMDWLAGKDLIVPQSRRDLLRNALVLVAPRNSDVEVKIEPGFDLVAALGGGRLAIGDPAHVPAGIYARRALEHLGVWKSVADRTARTPDVRAALALVGRGEAPLGIVYATDAKASKKVRVVDTFPRASHPPIVYPAALVAGHDTKTARAFLAFLDSEAARAIFAGFGFVAE